MEAPDPPASPERTAWAVAETPWLKAWARFMRRAQAGGLPAAALLLPALMLDGVLPEALRGGRMAAAPALAIPA